MADILLTHSYFLRFDPKQFRTMMPYPPLGTLYAGAVLRESGFSVALFDSMLAEKEEDLYDTLQVHQPNIVAIYDDDFNYLTKMCLSRMRVAAFRLSEIAKKFGAAVIVHSSDAVDHAEEYLAHGADYVVVGEGEQTLLEVCRALNSGSSPAIHSINGIVFRYGNQIVRTPKRRLIQNLDALPFPAWELVDIEKYRSLWTKHHGYFSVNMVTTRGCPFHCNWCAKPIYGQVYNSRSPEHVVEEMKFLRSALQPDHIWFADDIFGLKPGWVQKFSETVQREKTVIPFKCLSRVDLLLKNDTIPVLKHAGCETVWIGAESGSQKILDAMEKGITVEQVYQSTSAMKRHGIRVGFFLQFGYSGEERSDIDATLRMVRECSPEEIGISVSYPLPGTKFYESVKTELKAKQNWVDSDDLEVMFAGRYTPEFYRVLHSYTHKQFQTHRAHTILCSLLKLRSMNRKALRTLALSPYYLFSSLVLKFRLHTLEAEPNPKYATVHLEPIS
ncbi:MAG: B12-binding domain-containing radical SAM protein [Bacteroidota bacterium]|nr:B12-binding domain-containing radical SAM protein [Bacteroidota bacterium]